MTSTFKVLIIGGGLGGLALAQGLRKYGMQYEIYERDKNAEARSQGWVLSLHWILESLLADTPDDMADFDPVSIGHEAGIEANFAYYDAITGEEQRRLSHSKEKPLLRSDRGRVRRWLMHNLKIHWNKHFECYEETTNGVKVWFTDGSTAEGSVLVGADGVNSSVRDQLMKGTGLKPRPIPLGNITAVVDLDEEQCRKQLKLAHSFYMAHSPNCRLFVGLRSIASDQKSASFYWRLSWYDDAAKKEPYWTVLAEPERLLDYAKSSTKDFHPSMTEALRSTSASGVVSPSLVFWDMLPVPLPRGKVTLLGDAIHPMSPFRGEGGNHAMADGLKLAKCLADGRSSPVLEVLKIYEAEMLARGSEGVLKSREAAEDHIATQTNTGDKVDKDWLAKRIDKQAGDQGFKRV